MRDTNFENHISSFYRLCKDLGKLQLDEQKNLDVNLKSDNTPVTNIDLYSSKIIVQHISECFDGDIIISEESYTSNNGNSCYWLIDPIDGTKNYIKGGNEFCICISYIKNNYPIFGIIYIPASKEFYYAIEGKGSYLINDMSKSPKKIMNIDAQNNIYVSSTIRQSLVDMLETNFNNSNLVYMSSAVKFVKIADGQGHLSLRLGPTYEWDTAAGQCIVEESGGLFLDKDLKRFSYGNTDNYLNSPFFVINGDIKKYESTIFQSLSLVGLT
mgnify:FL=1|tara:strand:- start:4662 stop:5471 length:810 start_codon:yes stop_codon:yes gene_type:complete